MLRTFTVLGIVSAVLSAAENPIKETSARAIIDHRMPNFRNGYLYVVDPSNIVTVFAPDGHQLTPMSIIGKGHGHVSIEGVAIDADGTLAIGWTDGPDAGIDFCDTYGNLIRTMDTGRFIASDLSFGEGHTLWALGWQRDAVNPNRVDAEDYATVRKFSREGSALGSYLPKSLFLPGLEPGAPKTERGVTVTQDCVGIELISGHVSNQQEWIELDLNGNLKGRWKLDRSNESPGVAFTNDDHAYVARFDQSAKVRSLYRLNHASSVWEMVVSPGGYLWCGRHFTRFCKMAGFGNALVMVRTTTSCGNR